MESNNYIDRFFREVLKNFDSVPVSDVWGRIEDRLNRVSVQGIRTNYLQYAVSLFLFLSLCLITVPLSRKTSETLLNAGLELSTLNPVKTGQGFDSQEKLYNASGLELNESKVVSANRDYTRSGRNILAAAEELIVVPSTPKVTPQESSKAPRIVEREINSVDNINTDLEVTRVYNLETPMSALSAETLSKHNHYAVASRPIDEDHLKIDLKGMYMGVNGSYNQTSLLEYGNLYRGTRPIQPSLKFGTAKGITVGYNFNNHFGLQGDYIYNAILGQNYVTSDEELVTEKSLTLNYDQFALTARFKQPRFSDLTRHPFVVNYIGGFQYGYLRDYRLPQEKRWESTEELFKNYDISLVLGIDYEIYLDDQFFITIGGRSTIGTDISLHNEPFDEYAKRNFVFGIRGGLNYVFR